MAFARPKGVCTDWCAYRRSTPTSGGIPVLPASMRSPNSVTPKIELFGVTEFGDRIDAGKTGMPPLVGVERRYAHQSVHTPFGLAKAIGVFTRNQHHGALN